MVGLRAVTSVPKGTVAATVCFCVFLAITPTTTGLMSAKRNAVRALSLLGAALAAAATGF